MAQIKTIPCPMCGRVAGRKAIRKKGSTYLKLRVENFWAQTSGFDPDKPFGVIMETTGKGTFHKVGTFQPEEDAEYFPFVKARVLNVVKEWVAKGWLSQSEVAAAARGLVVAPTPPAPPQKKTRTS